MRYLSRFAFAACCLFVIGALPPVARAAEAPSAAGLDLFEKKIRPTLINECYKCHSATSEKLKGNLQLDTRDGMLTGGDSGPAVVPGDPANSLLLNAIRRVDKDTAMPPKKTLGKDVIADFTQWIQLGAPWPHQNDKKEEGDKPAVASGPAGRYESLRKELWSWQPIAPTAPPKVESVSWAQSDIDRFVLTKLEDKGLKPSQQADRATLLRRATFDLIGLPPSAAEIDAFVKDTSPDAFAKVVDRLLASPRFGERWGRHWLDVARYAESSGMTRNYVYYYAWRYRDYVINAFNADKPYNTFVTEQLAGDLMPYESSQQHDEHLIATGFLAMGPKDYNEKNQQQFQANNVDEQIDATGKAFLATTISCARCHDHKFDPIPTAEYYSLAGIFKSTEELPGLDNRGRRLQKYSTEKYLHLTGFTPGELNDPDADDYEKLKDAAPAQKAKKLMALRAKITNPAGTAPKHFAMGVSDAKLVSDAHILVRGEVDHPGETVRRGFLSIPCISNPPSIGSKESGRLELAKWITDPSNPLTARVMVNRIWGHLFGQAIVKSVDNFGFTGERPSQPELLDFLASQFMKDGWSVKKTIRQIMLTSTYQQSSAFDKAKFTIDPDNALLWRMNQRRLEGEAIRDAILTASGKLALTPPSGSVTLNFPEIPIDIAKKLGSMGDVMSNFGYRSVYLPVYRNDVPAVLEVFDMADPNVVDGRRDVTTVAPQALFMMNSTFAVGQSKWMVERLANSGAKTDTARVDLAYTLTLGRAATSLERDRALAFVSNAVRDAHMRGEDTIKSQTTGWSSFCQALFACAEFRYLN
jgi:cytochrome c553